MHKRLLTIVVSSSLVLVLVCSVLLLRSFSQTADQGRTGEDVQHSAFGQKILNGYYSGISDVPAGRISWFLRIDSEKGTGELYLPPQIIHLRSIVLKPNGDLSFNLVEDERSVARFEGRLDGNIRGSFVYADGHTITATLEEVRQDWFQQETASYSGVYSNVKYVEEAGDLVGTELLLIPQANSLGGSLTVYEGVPGNIYALSDVRLSGRSIQFSIVTSTGLKKFSGELSSDKIILEKSETVESNSSLPKINSLVDCLKLNSSIPPTMIKSGKP